MTKYCGNCGLINSDDGRSVCKACGGSLADASAPEELGIGESTKFASSCCPNPECKTPVVLPAKNFCGDCGFKLEPPSYELWVGKYVKPALADDPAGVTSSRKDRVSREGTLKATTFTVTGASASPAVANGDDAPSRKHTQS